MTIVVIRDVADRFRGFLASCMLEIAPGVFTAAKMTQAVRDRVWGVAASWFDELGGAILMTWDDTSAPGGQGLRLLGDPPKELVEYDGLVLCKRRLPDSSFEERDSGP